MLLDNFYISRLAILIGLLISTACSSYHIDHGYYLQPGLPSNQVKTLCKKSGQYGDMILLSYNNDAQIKIFVHYYTETGLWGPVLFPLLPTFWSYADFHELSLRIEPQGTIVTNSLLWKLQADGKNEWKSATGSNDAITFAFDKKSPPDRLVLQINNLKLNGKEQPAQELKLERKGYRHYEPLVFLHTEWPYGNRLPCEEE